MAKLPEFYYLHGAALAKLSELASCRILSVNVLPYDAEIRISIGHEQQLSLLNALKIVNRFMPTTRTIFIERAGKVIARYTVLTTLGKTHGTWRHMKVFDFNQTKDHP